MLIMFKNVDPTAEQIKTLKRLYKLNHSYAWMMRELEVGTHIIHRWIRVLGLKKIDVCSWCGKKDKGKRIYKAWLCEKCDSHRCTRCNILLSNTRISKKGQKKYGAYNRNAKLCKDCETFLRENKVIHS